MMCQNIAEGFTGRTGTAAAAAAAAAKHCGGEMPCLELQ